MNKVLIIQYQHSNYINLLNFCMVKKHFFYLVLLSFLSTSLFAQIKILKKPRIYQEHPTGLILPKSTDDAIEILWVVYSDRNQNKTFQKANATSSEKKVANFLDAFFVSEEDGSFLHIYKADDTYLMDGKKGRYSLKSNAEDYGWIPKTNLLLWERCVENERYLSKKALPIVTKENDNMAEFVKSKDGTLNLFEDPQLSKKSKKVCEMFQFLFIYKEEDDAVLLATANNTNKYNADKEILGWVNKKVVQLWSDRICLEPDYDEEAADKRKNLGIKASLFQTEAQAQNWREGKQSKDDAIWDNDPFSKRWNPQQKRLPILEFADKEGGIVKTGRVTGIFDEKGEEVISTEDHSINDKAANKIIAELKKFNIIFVVDGSNRMQPYLKSVRDIVSTVADRMNLKNKLDGDNENDENNKIYKYGCIFYRGEQDNKCNGVDISIAERGLTSQSSEVLDFIDKQSNINSCDNGFNMKTNEGLERALRMFVTIPNQTNIVVLIGGPKTKDKNEAGDQKIVDLITKTNTNLLAFR